MKLWELVSLYVEDCYVSEEDAPALEKLLLTMDQAASE